MIKNKDVAVDKPAPSNRGNRRRGAVVATVVTAVALFLGGCNSGTSPQEPYQPGIVYHNEVPSYGDTYPYDDGGIAPDRFDPTPAQGPYSPDVNSPYN